ncbi:MAG: 3-dehydroquinate dehydratase [Sulfurimonas sp.]|nr:3-dehydroquinate dehydratase [Sulfurimonas sp.]
MKYSRGFALFIFIGLLQITLNAQYLYKDEVVNNPKFTNEIELLGKELYEKTGIALRLIMLKDLPSDMNIVEYQQSIMTEFDSPTVLLTFAEQSSRVDILASDASLYKYFDKNQILSPVASIAQAIAMAVFFAGDIADLKSLISNSGGTILPLLGDKTKATEHVGKYSAAMYNGYLDLGEQISHAHNVELSMGTGSGSENIIMSLKIIFYSMIFLALIVYIKNKYFTKGKSIEV